MSKRDEVDGVSLQIELIDDTIVTNPQTKIAPCRQTMMRKLIEQRSHLINLVFIKSYNKGKGGFVTMTDNTDIEVSTRRKDDFLKRLPVI